MNSQWRFHLREAAIHAALGGAGIAAITTASYLLQFDFAIVGCLYLLCVVVQSTVGDFASCAIVSLVAVVSLDYFFVPPVFSLGVDKPVYWLALITFLVTALVITRLASRAREEARRANAGREDLACLYEVASRLVSVSPEDAVQRKYLGIFRDVFRLSATCLFDAEAAAVSCEGNPERELASRTQAACLADRDEDDRERKIAIRCLRVGGKPIGAVAFQGIRDADTTAGPLSVLAAAMIQRAHSFVAASEAAAAAQVEVLRSALLDAFAHQFKTPLASILTAAGSLREVGPLLPEQLDMVETIETQSSGLGRLTTRLLRTARLDRNEIRPKMQMTDLCGLVARIGEPYCNPSYDRSLTLNLPNHPVQVLADPEMLGLGLVQLVDNAFRYSRPGGAILLAVDAKAGSAFIRVTNEGSSVPPEEHNKIFDRFYRGAAGHFTAGTGLGLYIARKITLAHGGTLELDYDHVYGPNTTFYLKLPLAKEEHENALSSSQSLGSR